VTDNPAGAHTGSAAAADADRVRVVVATTRGPATIQRITEEDPALRSVICLRGTPRALPVSAGYDAFVRAPTGVIERETGHRTYRVDVDAPIEEGESWQLALILAHRLKQAGRLAETGTGAGRVWWLTGTVDRDLRIGPVARIQDKLALSSDLFRECERAGMPCLAILPEDGAVPDLPASVELLRAGHVDAVPVADPTDTTLPSPTGSPAKPGHRRRFAAVLIAGLAMSGLGGAGLAIVGLGVAGSGLAQGGGLKWLSGWFPTAPGGPDGLALAQPDLAAVGVEVTAADGRLAVRIHNPAIGSVEVVAALALSGEFREYLRSEGGFHRVEHLRLAAGETVDIELTAPAWIRRPVDGVAVTVIAAADLHATAEGLRNVSAERLPARAAEMSRDGVRVELHRQRVSPAQ